LNRPNLERITFLGRCPQCGTGKIFSGLLAMHSHCSTCGLHILAREQGDGPAFFGIVIIGALATIGAAITEIVYAPPYWLHAALWLPFILIGSVICLRFAKACLLGLQYGARPEDFNS
jgi:uncharacterized protein (DUF983 family)